MKRALAVAACVATIAATSARAVEARKGENGGGKVSDRWAVVGLISAGDDKGGIAVVKNVQNNRTYTISVGDELPTEFGFVLQSIKDRKAVLSDGKERVTLGFTEGSTTAEEPSSELPSRTARFLDNYYRGLNEMPIDIFGDSEDGLNRLKGEARSRFDLYRADRSYDEASPDGAPREDEPGFVVNYDNFEDEGAGVTLDGEVPPDEAVTIRRGDRERGEGRPTKPAREMPNEPAEAVELTVPLLEAE